jgi:hypothetical protein
MPSFIVETSDIGGWISEATKTITSHGGTIRFVANEVLGELKQYPRIRYFYYCDDLQGITIRLFDESFWADHKHLTQRKSRVIFRAKNAGTHESALKQSLLKLWEDVSIPPAGMHAMDSEKATAFFEEHNRANPAVTLGTSPMHDALKGLLDQFVGIRSSTPFGTHRELWSLMDGLMFAVKALPAYKERSYLKYSWSLGAGSWALVPWVALLNKTETTSTEQGVYCALLFREDMSGLYVCLSQGITSLSKKLPKMEAYSELSRRASVIQSKIRSLELNGFVVGPGIDLHATGNLGKGYERATIAYKFYDAAAIPADDVIAGDITALLQAYDVALEAEEPSAVEEDVISVSHADAPEPRVWIYAPGDRASFWDELYEQGLMAIGWDELGDLRQYSNQDDHVQAHSRIYQKNTAPMNDAKATYDFASRVQPGDQVFATRGLYGIVGYGVVTGDYQQTTSRKYMHHTRKIRWLASGEWESPIRFPVKTLTEITNQTENVEKLLELVGWVDESSPTQIAPEQREDFTVDMAVSGLFMSRDSFDKALDTWVRKQNLILQGAPGVGKTFVAKRLAYALMGFKDPSRLQMVQFHQAYSYEDFVQGYRPHGTGFRLRDGVFYDFCQKAMRDPNQRYVFVIDEINRGNLSKIFGELMMLIESDKRKSEWGVKLTYSVSSEEKFYVPSNVYLLGMMNTADRSLSVVDYALRRRFAFITVQPSFEEVSFQEHLSVRHVSSKTIRIIRDRIGALNEEIESDRANLGKGFCIGHSYFCDPPLPGPSGELSEEDERAWYERVVDSEILPLLEEYWFDSPDKVDQWQKQLKW